MIITLKDTVFCVTGGFRNHPSRLAVEQQLQSGGALITQSVSDRTQVLVYGYGANSKVDDAALRGIPILEEPSLAALLAHGEVEIDFKKPSVEAGDDGINMLLGEARSALSQPPGAHMWAQIVSVLDRCAPEQIEVLVEYLQPHILRWDPRQQMFCVAPNNWLVSMMDGVTSACYRLVRWLDLTFQRISATVVRKIIGCEDLTCVRRLDLPLQKHASASLMKALVTTPRMESLRVLCFGRLGADIDLGLDAGDALRNVHTIACHANAIFKDDWRYLNILCSDSFEGVTRFRVIDPTGHAMMDHFDQDEDILPGLVHIDLVAYHSSTGLTPGGLARTALKNPILATSIKVITLASVLASPLHSDDSVVDLSAYTQLQTLRLYTKLDAFDAPDALANMEHLFHLDRMCLPPSLQTIVTNLPLDAPQVATFMRMHNDIEVIEDPLGLDF